MSNNIIFMYGSKPWSWSRCRGVNIEKGGKAKYLRIVNKKILEEKI